MISCAIRTCVIFFFFFGKRRAFSFSSGLCVTTLFITYKLGNLSFAHVVPAGDVFSSEGEVYETGSAFCGYGVYRNDVMENLQEAEKALLYFCVRKWFGRIDCFATPSSLLFFIRWPLLDLYVS